MLQLPKNRGNKKQSRAILQKVSNTKINTKPSGNSLKSLKKSVFKSNFRLSDHNFLSHDHCLERYVISSGFFRGETSELNALLVSKSTKEDIVFIGSNLLNLVEIESNDTLGTTTSVLITTESPYAGTIPSFSLRLAQA